MRHAITSLTVLDAQSGQPVFTHNEEVGLATASCMKTITAATAYGLLGEDFRYTTRLGYSGMIKGDTLFGDLVIQGSGDPTLGSWRYESTKMDLLLQQWVEAVHQAGIRVIAGSVLGDAHVFDTQMLPDGWIWQDVGNYYGAGASGLCWHENQYDLHIRPGQQAGEPAALMGTQPPMEQLRLVNELGTGSPGSGDQTYIYAAPYSNLGYVRGTAPAGHPHFQVSGAVPDPALFCAASLQKALATAQVKVEQPLSTYRLRKLEGGRMPEALHLLSEHHSPSLSPIIHWFLKKSINLYGEQLIKTIALHQGQPVSTANGVQQEVAYWEQQGLDPDALHIIDGSGLSPGNRVTTRALARVLFHVRQQSWYNAYFDCLPVIHNIHMKSGHINDVAAYCGYLSSRNGTPLVFSFIVNNYSGPLHSLSPKIFRLLDALKK